MSANVSHRSSAEISIIGPHFTDNFSVMVQIRSEIANYSNVIVTKFCTWNDGCGEVALPKNMAI